MEENTTTLLCGDLFTQGAADLPALTESDILGPSEAFRQKMDYFSTHQERPRLARKPLDPQRWPVCTAVHGMVMEPNCFVPFLMSSYSQTAHLTF